ncbi:MAG: type II toxin-antitoxin system RelE/ParE family toxin [Candidatus Omnitrophota bacterium]
MKPFIYHEEALQEIGQSARYYAEQRTSFGEEFKQAILDAEDIITRNPRIGVPISYTASAIRKFHLKRFPYSIFYYEYPDYIFIISIEHDRRRPGYWMDRIE